MIHLVTRRKENVSTTYVCPKLVPSPQNRLEILDSVNSRLDS